MKRSSRPQDTRSEFRRTLASLAVAACFVAAPFGARANPTGATVVNGTAGFATSGNTLTVTNTPGAIINWQQFNIGAGETTRFNQQSAQSAVLNRVVSNNPSSLLGTLQSNGQVFLLNQSGILVGANAVIDVNKFVASTLNLSDADFLAKRFNFSGGNGSLINQGTITTPLGGSVWLIGKDVRNEGIVTSPQGQVLLAAGNTVSLVDSAGPELSVTLSADANRAVNLGTITAQGGRIDMFGALVEHAGILRADSAGTDAAGNIVLKASLASTVSGTLSATSAGGRGGNVQVLGDSVTLTGSARIDASGASGGGNVLVGGDWQGANPAVANATDTFMAAGATIRADATVAGDGGKVVLWANNRTDFKGAISARGGDAGGNGGAVETSGHTSLDIGGTVDTRAPLGKTGNWLLDPASICIYVSTSSECLATAFSGATSLFAASTLDSLLSTANPTIQATDYFAFLPNTGTPLSYSIGGSAVAGNSLTVTAPYIHVGGTLDARSNSKWLNVTLNAAGTSSTFPSLSGTVEIDKGGLLTGGGLVKIDAERHIFTHSAPGFTPIISTSPLSGFGSGNISLRAPKIEAEISGSPGSTGVAMLMNPDNDIEIETDTLKGNFQGQTGWLSLNTYSAGRNMLFGYSSSHPSCSGSTPANFCYSNQFLNLAAIGGDKEFIAGRCATPGNNCDLTTGIIDGDITIGGGDVTSWRVGPQASYGFVGRNIVQKAPIQNTAGTFNPVLDPLAIFFVATNTYTNEYGPGAINVPAGSYWGMMLGNQAGSSLNGLVPSTTLSFASLADLEAYAVAHDNDPTFGLSGNTVLFVNSFANSSSAGVVDPCVVNPTLCATTTATAATLAQQATSTSVPLTLQSQLSIDAKLTADANWTTTTTTTTPIVASVTTSNGKANGQGAGELREGAKNARNDAKKAEAEAKKAEAEAKQAESEAKSAKSPQQRAAAQAKADAKRAEAEAKRAEAEAKQATADRQEALADNAGKAPDAKLAQVETRQALADSRQAEARGKQAEAESRQAAADAKIARSSDEKTVVAKRVEAKKAEAEAYKSEAQARKIDAEAKQAAADAKAAKTPEQKAVAEKRADSKLAEARVKQAEAEGKHAEARAKQAEAEGKRAEVDAKTAASPETKAVALKQADAKKAEAAASKTEAQAKKIESEARKAEADAKTATSPQQKQAAEKRAEAKRSEAEIKKADADGKHADARAKQAEVDVKVAEAEVKSARSPEQREVAQKQVVAKKSEADAQRSEARAKKAEGEAKQAEQDAKLAKTPQQKASAEKKAEAKRADAETSKVAAEAKHADARSKQADAEAKQAEADAKSLKAPAAKEVAEKRGEAKKAEADAHKAKAEEKQAEERGRKAEHEAKQAKADAAAARDPGRKAQAEKKAKEKENEADKAKAEMREKAAESEKRKAEAEKKGEEHRIAAKKREDERRIESAKAFAKTAVAATGQDVLKAMLQSRHELKAEALKPAINVLERNPGAADLPACGSGAEVCVPTRPAPAAFAFPQPTLAFLPQIQRKVAVVIGINEYAENAIPSLESALPDAEAVGKSLADNLGYEVRVVRDATRADIVKSLRKLSEEVGPNDSVAIYYAGHGYLSENTNTGYWIPSDAKVSSPENWLSNNDVSKLMNAIPAKQVMLVSDSCYSGSLAKEQKVDLGTLSSDPSQILAKRSVTVMSSGGEEPVSDQGKEGHSVFAWNLMNALKGVAKFEPGAKLFETIRDNVSKELPQTPQYGAAPSAGHTQGSDYLFEKRSYK